MATETLCTDCKKPVAPEKSGYIVMRGPNRLWHYCDDCMRIQGEINTAVTEAKSNTIEGKLDEIIRLLTRISNRPPA